MTATVIILNGVGSAGKSSIARALQGLARRPLLHVAMDSFLEMLPPGAWNSPEGIVFERLVDESGLPEVAIRSGPLVARALAGLRGAVAALAAEGNDLVVDEVLFGAGPDVEDYRRRLAPFRVRWVAIRASLAVLEERERARGDREIGLARWQYERVHRGMTYDLTLDSGALGAEACAAAIRDAFDL